MNPGGWGNDAHDNGSSAARGGGGNGLYDMDVVVNPDTSITIVALPAFDKNKPLQGTKPARESILKLLSGMCNDVCPLNYRTEELKDGFTPDPYFKGAPSWSTLSGGRRPYITASPADIAEKIERAANCVPLIRSVRLFVLDAQGNRRQVTLEELKEMNIQVQEVPNLYRAAAAATAGAGAAPVAAPAPPVNLAPLTDRQQALEAQVAAMQALLEKIAASAVPLAPTSPAVASAAPSTSSAAEAPAPAAMVEDADDEEEPTMSAKRRGKRPRRVV